MIEQSVLVSRTYRIKLEPINPAPPVTKILIGPFAIGTSLPITQNYPAILGTAALPDLFRKNGFTLCDGQAIPCADHFPAGGSSSPRKSSQYLREVSYQRADVAASLCSSAISTFSRTIFVARQRDSNVPASVHPPSMTS